MFGTVARIRVKPGKAEELMRLGNEYTNSTTGFPGLIAEYIYKLDGSENEYLMAVVFTDRESYVANAQRPETNEFYGKYRELLEADPEWNDGEIVWSYTGA